MDKRLVKKKDLDMELELCSTDAELELYFSKPKYAKIDDRINRLYEYMNVTGVTRMGIYDEAEEYAVTKESFLAGFWKNFRELELS